MMNKNILLTPFFIPIVFILTFSVLLLGGYFLFPDKIYEMSIDGGIIEIITHSMYLVTLYLFYKYREEYPDKKIFSLFIFLTIAALCREMGIQHVLASADTAAFKLRFYTNPNNPIGEKILSAVLAFIVLYAVCYLMYHYMPYLVKGFLQIQPLPWTLFCFFSIGALSKIVDRAPSNLRKMGIFMSETMQNMMLLFEEAGEMFLPILVSAAIIQKHVILTAKQAPKHFQCGVEGSLAPARQHQSAFHFARTQDARKENIQRL